MSSLLEPDIRKLGEGLAALKEAKAAEDATVEQMITLRDQLIENQQKLLELYQAELTLLKGYTVLTEPLKADAADEDGWVEGIVALDLARIIDLGHEGMLDELSTLLVGNDLLQDFSWDVVGWDHTRPGQDVLHIKVTGYAISAFANAD